MTAWTARALAARGFGVLQIDLLGCGESPGDFGEATWDVWIEDALSACAWLRRRATAPIWLWALRAGALLTSAMLPKLGHATSLLLWQPVLSGPQYLAQFLRMKLAGERLADRDDALGTKHMREQLRAGYALEVGGYLLSPAIAAGLEGLGSTTFEGTLDRVVWFEVSPFDSHELSPLAQSRIAALRGHGTHVDTLILRGPAFWQTVEIEDCPALISASVSSLADRHRE